MIFKDEKYIQLAELDADGDIVFTKEIMELTKDFAGLRRFAAQLIAHWGPEYAGMLDYFGSNDSEADQFSGIDGDKMDVREDIADVWSYRDLAAPDLDAEWYRDVMRAKLISIRLPERIIKEYIKAYSKV